MKRLFYILPMLTLFLSSCSEKDEVSEYENWQARNQHYVDSIASLANAGTDGWTKMLVYYLVDSKENPDKDNNHYVYIKKLENGTGTQSPEFKDSVRVHYIGRLIPSSSHPQGYVFGKSYSTYTFNEDTDVPALMNTGESVIATPLMHMVEGDRWKVVVPYFIGYGTNDYSLAGIPGYSSLTFDVKLARIYKYRIDTDTTWH